MSEAYIMLLVILLLGLVAKNLSVIIAVGILLAFKLFRLKVVLSFFDQKGMDIGLTIMMVALLAPIAMGSFGMEQFTKVLREPLGVVAIILGVTVTVIARQGVNLMASTPTIVPMAISGIIIGVVLLKGVPVGPMVATGLTAALWGILKFFFR